MERQAPSRACLLSRSRVRCLGLAILLAKNIKLEIYAALDKIARALQE